MTTCWLSIFVSVSGQRFQSPAWVFRRKTENINVCKVSTSLHICRSNGNCSIQINKVKDWTFRFQKNKCTLYQYTLSNARNNRINYRSKFLEKFKQVIPTKLDKSCDMMDQNQQNSCVRYFSCCVNVTGFLSIIFSNLTKVLLQKLYVSLKISEGRFVFALPCP